MRDFVSVNGVHPSLLDHVPDGVIVVAPSLEVRLANAAACRFHGWEPDAVIGRSLGELLEAELDGAALDLRRAAVESFSGDVLVRDAEGRGHIMEWTFGALCAPDEPGFTLVERDVTEARTTVRTLAAVVDSAPCGMLVVDPAGVIQLANAEVARIFGYDEGELDGVEVERLLPDRLRVEHRALRRTYLRAPSKRPMGQGRDLVGRCKDGDEVSVEVALSPIATPEGPRVVALICDITERRALMDELASMTDALRRSNRDLEQFAYVAAHDLREPLRAVASFSAQLIDRYGDALDERGRAYADLVRGGTLRMQSMIEGLLDVARVDAEADRAPLALDRCLDAALEHLAPRIEETGAEIDRAPLPKVIGNEGQLTRVLTNLLDNAIKFAGEGAPWIRVRGEARDERVVVTVEDRGIGIPEEQAARIFEVFRRLHPADAFEGTGIGLAVVERVVIAHGGAVRAEPRDEGGARFVIELPAAS